MDVTLLEKLERIKESCRSVISAHEPIRQAEDRARQLVGNVPPATQFVGICGARLAVKEFDLLDGFLTIRQVSNPPGLIHVVSAANESSHDYLHVARHSNAVTSEIGAGNDALDSEFNAAALNLAYHAAALLKLCEQDFLTCPASSTISWDCIAACSDKSVLFHVLDEIPRAYLGRLPASEIGLSDLEWVRDKFKSAFALRNHATSRRFGLAFNIAYIWNHTNNPRIALSNVWSGLEALFGARGQNTSRAMAARIATWLPETSVAEVMELYSKRCDAVHGRWVDDSQIQQPLAESAGLLVKAVRSCIDRKKQTLPDWQ